MFGLLAVAKLGLQSKGGQRGGHLGGDGQSAREDVILQLKEGEKGEEKDNVIIIVITISKKVNDNTLAVVSFCV